MWGDQINCLSFEELQRITESLSNLVFLVKKSRKVRSVSSPDSTLPGNTNSYNAQTFLVGRHPSTFFLGFVIQIQNAAWWKEKKKTQRISVLDHFSVRAHDSVWTRNLHPRQQSGFHHRVIAVKPLLTGWCGSQRLVKCNVPQDSILAITLLHWDSFFISMFFLLFLFFFLPPFTPNHPPPPFIYIVFLSPICALVCWCC